MGLKSGIGRGLTAAILSAALAPIVAPSGHQKQSGPPSEIPARKPGGRLTTQAVQEAAAPGPLHFELARLSGDYTVTVRAHFQLLARPTESSGTAKLTSIAGGRFLVEESSGSDARLINQGRRIYGFNNGSQEYEGVWVRPGSTSLLSMRGTSRDGGRTINWVGKYTSDVGAPEEIHAVMRIIDPDHFVFEVREQQSDGAERVLLEEIYSRKK